MLGSGVIHSFYSVGFRRSFSVSSNHLERKSCLLFDLCLVCSYRSIGFEICLIIFHILSLLAAAILITFTAIFISGRHTCVGGLCLISHNYHSHSYGHAVIERKMLQLSILLASASIIFLTNLSFLFMYVVLVIRRSSRRKQPKIIYSDITDPPKVLDARVSEPVYYSGENEPEIRPATLPSAPPNVYYHDLSTTKSVPISKE